MPPPRKMSRTVTIPASYEGRKDPVGVISHGGGSGAWQTGSGQTPLPWMGRDYDRISEKLKRRFGSGGDLDLPPALAAFDERRSERRAQLDRRAAPALE